MIQDGFLYSTGHLAENEEKIKEAIDQSLAPPLLGSFQNEHSIQKGLIENDFRIEWTSDDELLIRLKGLTFLRMIKSNHDSHCLAINRDDPYGKKWR